MKLEISKYMEDFIESVDVDKNEVNIMKVEIKLNDKLSEEHKPIIAGFIAESILKDAYKLSSNGIDLRIK